MPNDDILLRDAESYFIQPEEWQVLRRGQDAGRTESVRKKGKETRAVVLRGGDRYRVELQKPYTEDDCDAWGYTAPPGTEGILVATCHKDTAVALMTDVGDLYIAGLFDIRPVA